MFKVITALRAENAILKQRLKLQAALTPKEKNNFDNKNDLTSLV
jgi:hypothetical protein